MKKSVFITLSCILLMSLASSCKKDELAAISPDPNPGTGQEETAAGDAYSLSLSDCTVEPLVSESDDCETLEASSRSQLVFGSNGMDFKWQKGDFLTVFSRDGEAEISNQYKLKGEPRGSDATFELSDFSLNKATCYLAFGQRTTADNISRVNIVDRDHIKLSYAGQKQIGNGTAETNTAHLGAYDYIAAAAKSDEGGHALFNFKHLGATLYLNFQRFWPDTVYNGSGDNKTIEEIISTADIRWEKVEMYADDNDFLEPSREFGLRNGLQVNETSFTYNPSLNAINLAELDEKVRFTIDIRDNENPELGIKVADGQPLKVFMEVPPIAFEGDKKFLFRLTGYRYTNNVKGELVTYFAVYKKTKPIKSGTAVKMTMEARPTSNFIVTVKAHLDWMNKATLDVEHSNKVMTNDAPDPMGDPGLKEEFHTPKYLYAWIFAYDETAQKNTLRATKILEGIDGSDWKESVNNYMLSYDFTFDVRLDASVEKCVLYAIASKANLSDLLTGYLNMEANPLKTEEEVRSLKFSVPSTKPAGYPDENNQLKTYEDFYQDYIKNIWSTPYTDDDSYVGNVYIGMNANMHHVASKVDFQWNTAYKLNNFALANLSRENLSFFFPTSNPQPTIDNLTTTKIVNYGFDNGSTDSWNGTSPAAGNGCLEFYNKGSYDFYKEISGLNTGSYQVSVQGFYRWGGDGPDKAVEQKDAGTEQINAVLYATTEGTNGKTVSVPLPSIFDGAGKNGTVGASTVYGYVPNTMGEAADYFSKYLYAISLPIDVQEGQTLRIGIKKEALSVAVEKDWTIFDNFQLTKYNGSVQMTYTATPDQWYNGRKVFYVPQYAPSSSGLYQGYTILYLNTDRSNGKGGSAVRVNQVPFKAEGVYPSWFRGNVTIK